MREDRWDARDVVGWHQGGRETTDVSLRRGGKGSRLGVSTVREREREMWVSWEVVKHGSREREGGRLAWREYCEEEVRARERERPDGR